VQAIPPHATRAASMVPFVTFSAEATLTNVKSHVGDRVAQRRN
jgi:hypothetical protein